MRLGFNKVGKLKKGYNPSEVDSFLQRAKESYEGHDESFTIENIQSTVFTLVNNGYSPSKVDAALDRLVIATVNRKKDEFILYNGKEKWDENIKKQLNAIYERLNRPNGLKFKSGEKSEFSYSKSQVDELCDKIKLHFDNIDKDAQNAPQKASVGKKDKQNDLCLNDVAQATFTTHKGKKGYKESSVDLFLDKVYVTMQEVAN
jgi:DivIVA domain-containing protein